MRYFPLDGSPYAMSLGVRPLLGEPLLAEPDAAQIAQKQRLLDEDYAFHCQALPGSEALQREAVEYLRLAGPFGRAARGLAEDLLLLADAPGWPLVAGVLCFPNDWQLADKLGQSLLAVHGPVPGFAAQAGEASLKLFERLKPERPVWRANWAIKVTSRLDLPPAVNQSFEPAKREITAANAGQRCYFRIERQTLSRLPSGVLFTVRTYLEPLESLSGEERRAVAVALRTMPGAMLSYKGIQPFLGPLLEWLD
ncbi:MAG: DUF3445 domain-containing protein [Bryobacteraceae bacterium]|nr:DUF3445 domain-containing protein [Bryobacteraceae bacterium]